ncbi:HNH endonuclease [Streptomyces sp. NPDC101112]|uniref:HNH endonuclease n=1 Tax=Streptomyces sp. NPDC101112 TaxID=3366105 RepID=UPI0038291083
MADTSCRVNPDANSRCRPWGDSGGYCGNPKCRTYLFPNDLDVDFAELAHIIPASPAGPRGVPLSDVPAEARAHHRNLILLCANCHTTIDKAPDPYPAVGGVGALRDAPLEQAGPSDPGECEAQ